MKNQHLNQLFALNLATLFISTSGALGKFIDLPTPVIIWWRSALTVIFLFLFCKFTAVDLRVKSRKDMKAFVISALFLGAHWITYFYALKLSNVAIGMLAIFTFPIITTLLEPLFVKAKFDAYRLILGVFVLLGVYLLVPDFDLQSDYFRGVLLGVFSALLYSIRNLIMKQQIVQYNGTTLMFYQVLVLSLVLAPALYFMGTSEIRTQYPYVIILALLTTTIGHTLFVRSFRYFAVSTASIITSFQPIYGIVIAYVFLNEIPDLNTYIGGSIILLTVIVESIRSRN